MKRVWGGTLRSPSPRAWEPSPASSGYTQQYVRECCAVLVSLQLAETPPKRSGYRKVSSDPIATAKFIVKETLGYDQAMGDDEYDRVCREIESATTVDGIIIAIMNMHDSENGYIGADFVRDMLRVAMDNIK